MKPCRHQENQRSGIRIYTDIVRLSTELGQKLQIEGFFDQFSRVTDLHLF
jgi:hypothetical protein